MATNRQPRDTVEEPEDDKSETGTTDSDGEIWVKSSAAGATPSSTKQTGEAECDSISCGDPFCMPVPIDKEGIKRRSRTLTFRRKKKEKSTDCSPSKKHTRFWTTFRLKKKLPGRLRKGKDHGLPDPHPGVDDGTCVCTGYRRTEDHVLGPGIVFSTRSFDLAGGVLRMSGPRGAMLAANSGLVGVAMTNADLLQLVPAPPQSCTSRPVDMPRFNPEEFPVEDIDDLLIAQRARDMEYGIDLVANRNVTHDVSPPRQPGMSMMVGATASEQMWNLSSAFQAHCVLTTAYPVVGNCVPVTQESHYSECQGLSPTGACVPRTVHTQVDFIHCLVPDLLQIANCSFYWGVMDRYEAEKILENRPEGSFLLRDSAQEEFLFSVSFRRYGRSLHARIEQWNHKFSFDSHDPGVYASDTVCGLIEHYKDPSCCMFFEPMLTLPLHRTFPFSLQHLCRAVICSHTTYDGANFLPLPKSLRQYLKYYHYKQKVRVRQFECPH